MARIKAAPSQSAPHRWEVFCDGRLVGPSMNRKEAFELTQRLEAGQVHPNPNPNDGKH
jgi:hypothetical protein